MRRKTCQYALLSALLVVGMFSPVLGFAEESCVCCDPPDDPCILYTLRLTKIEIPYLVGTDQNESQVLDRLAETGQDEEMVIIIEVTPSDCAECAQTYVLYRPHLHAYTGQDFHLTVDDPAFDGSDVVFSLTECWPVTRLNLRAVIFEEDYSSTDVGTELAGFLGTTDIPWATLGSSGSRTGAAAAERGWSVRVAESMLNNLYGILNDGDNEVVMPRIQRVTDPSALPFNAEEFEEWQWWETPEPKMTGTIIYDEDGQGIVRLYLRGKWRRSDVCGCSKEDAAREMQAEAFQKTATMNNSPEAPHPSPLQQIINTSPSGFHHYGPGSANLPKNSVGMQVTKRTIVKAGPNNSTVILKLAVVVIRFEDYSDYVYWDDVKECIDQEGNITSGTYDRGDGASRIGSKRSRSRSDFWKVDILKNHRYVWGSSVGSPLALSEIIDLSTADVPSVDEIVITTGAGGTLDLTELPATSAPVLAANRRITINADNILLDPGGSLSDLMSPVPTVKPGMDGIRLLLPEAVGVLTGDDILPIGVMSWASSPQTVSVSWQDSRGWGAPGTMPVYLPAGGMTFVNLLIHVPEGADLVSSSSMLTFTGISQSLGSTESICELIASTSVDADDVLAQPTEEEPAEPAVAEEPPEPGIPEEILTCTEDLGEASGTDYKNSGFRRHKVSPSKRLKFFKEEIDAYLGCSKLGPCARTVKTWLQQASLELQKELAEIFYTAFQKANR